MYKQNRFKYAPLYGCVCKCFFPPGKFDKGFPFEYIIGSIYYVCIDINPVQTSEKCSRISNENLEKLSLAFWEARTCFFRYRGTIWYVLNRDENVFREHESVSVLNEQQNNKNNEFWMNNEQQKLVSIHICWNFSRQEFAGSICRIYWNKIDWKPNWNFNFETRRLSQQWKLIEGPPNPSEPYFYDLQGFSGEYIAMIYPSGGFTVVKIAHTREIKFSPSYFRAGRGMEWTLFAKLYNGPCGRKNGSSQTYWPSDWCLSAPWSGNRSKALDKKPPGKKSPGQMPPTISPLGLLKRLLPNMPLTLTTSD